LAVVRGKEEGAYEKGEKGELLLGGKRRKPGQKAHKNSTLSSLKKKKSKLS